MEYRLSKKIYVISVLLKTVGNESSQEHEGQEQLFDQESRTSS
jgi:hypothetical protein